ncbi:MAG: hypothetical protein U0790_09090 [Isosphaeraceae bacterium]
MLVRTQPKRGGARRGVILILVLGILGLMALIGVTFATFSGQSRISARNFAQSVIQPQRDELMDYALAQLIGDTSDVRSAIRGHSLARDMYGHDGRNNGYIATNSDGGPLRINRVVADSGNRYNLVTNIRLDDSAFYGYNFTRWTLRVKMVAGWNPEVTTVLDQSLEILRESDDGTYRVFLVNINPTELSTTLVNRTPAPNYPNGFVTVQPAQYLVSPQGATYHFVLDGRWLHAFNGPGMTTNAVYGNFRYNGIFPGAVGMDEDYDAVDLENWFLAMQSADGQVVIPSFHRPAAVRYDPNGVGGAAINDWLGTAPDSTARILRPRRADGHDATTFPDLVPDATGRITYDVDNDGDGISDSVWVDLGYPARRNAQGRLFKPLFAFMVIGLNGRIPLNTAGNLAASIPGTGPASGPSHATHLGNSVSEVDPTYGLQNAVGPIYGQADNTGVDVRLTQLRNLLAGTRTYDIAYNPTFPYQPTPPVGAYYGDQNFVQMGVDPSRPDVNGNPTPIPFFLPNGKWDTGEDYQFWLRARMEIAPIPGRWGEAQLVPGEGIYDPNRSPGESPYNLIAPNYTNRVRAGYSADRRTFGLGVPRDAADDNFNSFDPFPFLSSSNRIGEVGDSDFFDPAGGMLLPVERMRRYVTPADINGSGRIVQWDGVNPGAGPDLGADQWGRVAYSSYFRPPGLPGVVTPTPPLGGPLTTPVTFPWAADQAYPTTIVSTGTVGGVVGTLLANSNPLHGHEAHRFPNLVYSGNFSPQNAGGAPVNLNANPNFPYLPGKLPTYDAAANGRSDGLNEADEQNLYQRNPQLDAPYSFSDLEWLYRRQDLDGSSLTSRLAKLAPISFDNPVDSLRRRRLYTTESWEPINYAWTNDNPAGAFPNNSRFPLNVDAGFQTWTPSLLPPPMSGIPSQSVTHRDKKINLNFPLPVSNDPDEAIRKKWITETYDTLKSILPPRAVDSAEELAQLSQYVINIVDFRDTDATMTHWRNPDVVLRLSTGTAAPFPVLASSFNSSTDVRLDQYGMEYNPVAINEVLAYSFSRKSGNALKATPRFFVELINTLTSPELGTTANPGVGVPLNNASVLDLSGFQSNTSNPNQNPWLGGCWDLVFTADDPKSRPDPITGMLQPAGSYYGLIPLVQTVFEAAPSPAPIPAPPSGDPVLFPLPQAPNTTAAVPYSNFYTGDPSKTPILNPPLATTAGTPNLYFMTIGNPLPASDGGAATEEKPFTPSYLLRGAWDPVDRTVNPPSQTALPIPGVLPPTTLGGPAVLTYPSKLPSTVPNPPNGGEGKAEFYWVCLRRPANPFAPVSPTNPMIVVDAMRFPYLEGKGSATIGTASGGKDNVTQGSNQLYSYQRLQPYRGGHAVPMPGVPGALDPRYGYSDQVAVPVRASGNFGRFGNNAEPNPQITQQIFHTLGLPNDGTLQESTSPYSLIEPWDYFPFNDRDFTSVAELLLVPGCPPGLFTKQFAELAPSKQNVANNLGKVQPLTTPSVATLAAPANASQPFSVASATPHAFPYLVDRFFYTAASPATVPTNPAFGDQSGDGWYRMFEFFEVPSQSNGAIGPRAQGMNFDWARQDSKPGLLNLNLIIDEEAFFSVFGQQDSNFKQQLLNFSQLPPVVTTIGGSMAENPPTFNLPLPAGASPPPMVVTATTANGSPAAAYPMTNVGTLAEDPAAGNTFSNRLKWAFAQFLSLRHGGSGYVFGYGSGQTGQNSTVVTGNPNAGDPLTSPIPADRPFRSLSFPDINYTIMRPAALPPSTRSDPVATPLATLAWPPGYNATSNAYIGDPGLRNPALYQGFTTGFSATPVGSVPQSTPAATGAGTTPFLLPPAIPPRRLFQVPDANPDSNAGDRGDFYLNNLAPVAATAYTGALPLFAGYTPTFPVVNLSWAAGATRPPGIRDPYLGANSGGSPPRIDSKQHPYFRTEMLQKAMNLTTVRTHQYAVWVTIGFFEVKRQGDLAMLGSDDASLRSLAFDILGPELGAASGQTTRYRGFFIVDRLQLTGFDPNTPGSFRPAVLYRQSIE